MFAEIDRSKLRSHNLVHERWTSTG